MSCPTNKMVDDELTMEFGKMNIATRQKGTDEEVINISDSSRSSSRVSNYSFSSESDLPSSSDSDSSDIEPPPPTHSIKSSPFHSEGKFKLLDELDDDDDDDLARPVPFINSKPKPTLNEYIRSVDKACGVLDITERKEKTKVKPAEKPKIAYTPESLIIDLDIEEDFLSTREKIQLLPLTDPRLEELDPNPDIHKLFVEFDRRFFHGLLCEKAIQLKWAKNLTSTAGAYYGHKKTIKLSSQLIKLRPRADLVNTLLHEMIHAYVHQSGQRDGRSHGPNFRAHMNRINKTAGTEITVFHSWRAEVKALKKYHWRCTGDICQAYGPTRGAISLPNQRRPNRFDYSYRFHEKYQCTGQFVPISDNLSTTTNVNNA